MDLKYRGISYSTAAPSVEAMTTLEQGTFRGAPFAWKHYRTTAAALPTEQLRFLGRPYTR